LPGVIEGWVAFPMRRQPLLRPRLDVRPARPELGWAVMGLAMAVWLSFPVVLALFELRGDAAMRLFVLHLGGGIAVFFIGLCLGTGLRIAVLSRSYPISALHLPERRPPQPPSTAVHPAAVAGEVPGVNNETSIAERERAIETGIFRTFMAVVLTLLFGFTVALLSLVLFGLEGLSIAYLLGTALVAGTAVLALWHASRSSVAAAALAVILGLPAFGVLLGLGLRRPEVVGVALFNAAVGGALIALTRWAGYRARRSPDLLLNTFETGTRFAIPILRGFLILQGFTFALVFLALEQANHPKGSDPERILFQLFWLFVPVVVAIRFGRKAAGAMRPARIETDARVLSRDGHGALWAFLENATDRAAAPMPQHVIAGLQPEFYVTEVDVETVDGALAGRCLHLSLPLCHVLTVAELTAVIGHELAHFSGDDSRFSQNFYPLYRGTHAALAELGAGSGGGSRHDLTLQPAIAALKYFLSVFERAERELSRSRELAADDAGAAVTSPATMAAALAKLEAFAELWNEVPARATAMIVTRRHCENLIPLFLDAVRQRRQQGILPEADSARTAHPLDTHPPFGERLAALGVELGSIRDAVLGEPGGAAAITLFTNPEALERELSLARLARAAMTLPA
jgi:Zn-dependent protease with chaperone function